jgi:DNA-binding MarR family transcriptional regulator
MELGLQLKKINDLMQKQANHSLEEIGLTFSQHHVLVYLVHCNGHETTLKDLEHRMEVAQSTMAGIVSRLEDKGFVKGFTDPDDLRIKKVRLTEAGEEICRRSWKDIQERERVLSSGMNAEEKAELLRLLDIVYTSLKEADPGKENA